MNLLTIFLQADAAAPAQKQNPYFFWIMMALVFVVMYFFMIRPQQKRQKEQTTFRNSLEKGQKIVTIGGVYGTIKDIKENKILVEIDTNVTVWFDRAAISRDPADIQQGGR